MKKSKKAAIMKKDDELKGMTDSIAEVFGNNVQWVDPNNDKVVMELKDGNLIDHEDQDEDEWRETLLATVQNLSKLPDDLKLDSSEEEEMSSHIAMLNSLTEKKARGEYVPNNELEDLSESISEFTDRLLKKHVKPRRRRSKSNDHE
jgi:phage I-like protein